MSMSRHLTPIFKENKPKFIIGFIIIAIIAIVYFLIKYTLQGNQAPPHAQEVIVQTIHPENINIWTDFSGRMKAVDSAEIRPQVSGRIMQVLFKDGQSVNMGDVLFVIDPRLYEAAVARAQANLASAKNNSALAQLEFGRAANLVKAHAIAQTILDQRSNIRQTAQNSIQSAEAELKLAKVNLDYAYVKAPISGRVSRAEITVGNTVEAGLNAPLLTSIVSDKGIYADFEVDEQTYMRTIHNHAGTYDKEQKIPVTVTIQGDPEHPYQGLIHTFDNKIEPTSGTIRARAKFANEDNGLVPGMFVTVKLASSAKSHVFLIPNRAVNNDQSKIFVYTVDKNNKVHYQEITLGEEVNDKRVVLSGLKAGDRVIVDGVMKVRPDMVVAPKEVAEEQKTDR